MERQEDGHVSSQELGQRFELLATDAKEYAIYLIDLDGRLICWNAGAQRIFGYDAAEIVGQHFSRFFLPEDIITGLPEADLERAMATGHRKADCWQVRKDGTRFWCTVTTSPLLDDSKKARSFARVVHDLTDNEALETQRRRADGLAEANRHREEFMALLSHELRSPLSPIRNALSILRQMRTNDPIIEQAGDIIDRQVEVMVRLVDDLLDITRITKGKLRLTKLPVEMRVIVNQAAETARPFMDACKHEFSVALPTTPLWVDADATRMVQVLVNLLNNAAKYSDPGGLIRLRVCEEAGEAVVRVQDNGVGISPEDLPHVFELFRQVSGSMGRSYGGLGIGLALASNLIEMHDGRLTASSPGIGKGCEFAIKMPLLQAPSIPNSVTTLVPNEPAGRSIDVLVVEDNVDAGDSFSMLLRLNGHQVRLARTGPIALQMCEEARPDVVFLDIGLPGMNGYQVARRLRDRPDFLNVVICALTGFTPSDADRQRHKETGFDRYFIKPIDMEQLRELFETVAGAPSAMSPAAPA